MKEKQLLGPWRRSFQWLTSLLILLLPWGHINQVSLLRVDFPTLSLQFLGHVLRIEELYLLLIFSLAFVLFFLLATLIFGRVWCGWACPQTTLSDIAEWATRRLKLTNKDFMIHGPAWRRALLHLFFVFLALLVASNLLWYFVEPRTFFSNLFALQLHPIALGFLLITAVGVYLDLGFLRRMICRDFCPYGRFQTVLVDPATLVLTLPDTEMPRCIKCESCVRACPMEIDIRQGYQIECINCGRCLDACRTIMKKRQEPGLIGYHFGPDSRGWKAMLSPRTLILAIGVIVLSSLLLYAVLNRSEATLKVAMSHQVSSRRLADGSQASFFNAWINNRTNERHSYNLKAVRLPEGTPVSLKGPTRDILLEAGQNRKVDFVLVTPFNEKTFRVQFSLSGTDSRQLSATVVQITSRQSQEYDQTQ